MIINKCFLFLTLFLVYTTGLYAEFKRFFYIGKLDNKYQICFDIQIETNKITGKYFYTNQSDFLWIDGKIEKDGQMSITEETNEGKRTGLFKGTISKDFRTMEGFWSSQNNKKKLPFNLSREAEYKQLKHEKYNAYVEYPSFCIDGNKEPAAIDEAIAKLAKRFYDSNVVYIESAIKEFGESDGEETGKYSFSSNCSIRYSDEMIKSIFIIHDSYTGGAHPNYYYTCSSYDNEGTEITLNSIIEMNEKSIKLLDKEITSILRKKEADWVVDESHPSFAEELSKNEIPCVFTPAGIFFYFAPYVAGSYAQGSFVTLITYDKIKSIIKPDSQIKYLIK